jgi:hypothetical protein
MAGIRRVVGIELDGTVTTVTLGRHEIRAVKAGYGDGLETVFVNEMGTQRQSAQTPGTYKTEDISITFRSTRFRAEVMPLFPKRGFGNIVIPIVVGFHHPDIGDDSDLLASARCVNLAAASEASNKALEVETKWKCLQIFWTASRKTLNALDGAVPVGASKF